MPQPSLGRPTAGALLVLAAAGALYLVARPPERPARALCSVELMSQIIVSQVVTEAGSGDP